VDARQDALLQDVLGKTRTQSEGKAVNETQSWAYIAMGEAGTCGVEAILAVLWMVSSGRNTVWSGWQTPSFEVWMLAYSFQWLQLPDPTPTAHFMFSASDTRLPSVRRIIGHDPPLRIFECQNGLALYAFA